MQRHSLTCNEGKPKIIFDEGVYNPVKNVFEEMEAIGIVVENNDRFYPYFIFYDFETWLQTLKTNSIGLSH